MLNVLGVVCVVIFPLAIMFFGWSWCVAAKRADQLDEECLRRVRRRR